MCLLQESIKSIYLLSGGKVKVDNSENALVAADDRELFKIYQNLMEVFEKIRTGLKKTLAHLSEQHSEIAGVLLELAKQKRYPGLIPGHVALPEDVAEDLEKEWQECVALRENIEKKMDEVEYKIEAAGIFSNELNAECCKLADRVSYRKFLEDDTWFQNWLNEEIN